MLPDQLASNGFTAEQWDELETMARCIVDKHAVLRHVIPRGADALGAYSVVVPEYDPGPPAKVDLTKTVEPTTLSARFAIASEQIGDFAVASRLVSRAARLLAAGEDIHLHRNEIVSGVAMKPPRAGSGATLASGTRNAKNASIEALVALGLHDLARTASPYFPPVTLAWSTDEWRIQHAALSRQARQALHESLGQGGRFLRVPGVQRGTEAILFPMDPIALDLVFVEHPTIALVQINGGNLELRLQERLLLRIMDTSAIIKLDLS